MILDPEQTVHLPKSTRHFPLFRFILVFITISFSGCTQTNGVMGASPGKLGVHTGSFRRELGRKLDTTEPKTKDTTLTEKILATAYSQMGKSYRYGGTSPKTGFDCAGYVQWVFKQHGIKLPRTSRDHLSVGKPVSKDELRPGDILVYYRGRSRRGTHVGIYTGDGKYIHSPHTGDRVKESEAFDSYHSARFIAARRVFNDPQAAPLAGQIKQALVRQAYDENGLKEANTGRKTSRKPTYHKVKKGETLITIAKRYRVSADKLKKANDIRSGRYLRIGQKLVIPGRYVTVADTAPTTGRRPDVKSAKYKIRRGDTASTIAEKHGISTEALMAANRMNSKSVLRPGNSLIIPGDAQPITSAPESPREYTVKSGDTLSTIAHKLGTSSKSLMAANNLKGNSVLRPGQKLRMPGGQAPAREKPTQTKVYQVESGDVLSTIAQRLGVSSKALMAANGLKSNSVLRPGQKLIVPDDQAAKTSAKTVYQVQRGDTASTIANRHGVTTASLLRANGLSSDHTLRPGQELTIP